MAHSFVAPVEGMSVVVDRECDDQDLDVLASLALTLSAVLSTSTLACLNHDDDALIMGPYHVGGLLQEYGWTNSSTFEVPKSDRSTFVGAVKERFGTTARPRSRGAVFPQPGFGRALALRVLMRIGSRTMAIGIHEDLIADMGLPTVCAGAGFRYVARGEFDDLEPHFERI